MIVKRGQVDGVVTNKSITVDQFGIVTQTITETINNTNTTSANAYEQEDWYVVGEESPDISTLRCVGVNLDDSGAIKTITKTYQGAVDKKVTFRLSAQGSQEPIQTHPAFSEPTDNFTTALAGNGADPKNKAIFKGDQEDSEFDYFPANADNDLAGVTGYLVPSVELEKTTVQASGSANPIEEPEWITEDIYKIAYIVDPQGNLSVGQRTWLLMGSSQEIIGGAVKSTAIYRLSGLKGWNNLIYFAE